jgi:hypothetical protein
LNSLNHSFSCLLEISSLPLWDNASPGVSRVRLSKEKKWIMIRRWPTMMQT